MDFSVIENTYIKVSRIGFGTGSLHHLFSAHDRQALLHAAYMTGITHFDTAPYYGYGLAECDLGKIISKERGSFTVTTKIGLYPWGASTESAAGVWVRKGLGKLVPRISLPVANWSVQRARISLRESLKRLRTDYVDFLFLHEPEVEMLDTDEFMQWLAEERDSGHIRAWGVAGVAERLAPMVAVNHPIATVIQTQDSIDLQQADFVTGAGRCLQFTYGYLSAALAESNSLTPEATLKSAFLRNPKGTILYSTRRAKHLVEISRILR